MNHETLFHLALDKPVGERSAFLEQACAGDEVLRRRVEALLRSHETPDSFLAGPAVTPTAVADSLRSLSADDDGPDRPDNEWIKQTAPIVVPGARIGPYKLLQSIGEGGMGTVYMAEQTEPVRRTVALKLIKAGMDSRQVLARFGAERQALALMDHPNIAKVFDAGTTPDGRPYFVMELVKGIPITRFCDERRLTTRERLELAIPVCQAVQHAHQKGIIHRDLKPSNVLIALYDGKPVPKVIDFGVAKATGPRLTDQTLYTEFGAVVGTLEYMSPEQAELNQLDIDTRSDIYSLGVLLYELLTGSTPLDRNRLKQGAILEMLRLIREEESPRPSMRLSTTEELPSIAACRNIEPRKLSGLVRGELDWIVMKALEKDRNRRYETANGLAADLRRYLDDEPVQACPPSAWYRFRKFARRNKLALMMAGLFVAALLIGMAGLTVSTVLVARSYKAERDAHRQAEANFRRARAAVDEFFTTVSQGKLLDVPGLQPLRKELLESAVRYYQQLAKERGEDATVQAGLAVAHFRLAQVNFEVDRNNDSIRELEAGLLLVEQLLKHNPSDSELFQQMAGFWKGTRRMSVSAPGPDDLATAERTLNKFIQIWEKLRARDPAFPAYQSDLAFLHDRLGELLATSRRLDEAVASSRKGVALWEVLVSTYPTDPEYQSALGQGYAEMAGQIGRGGKPGDVMKLTEKALALREKLIGKYPNVAQYREDLANSITSKASLLSQKGKIKEAEVIYRQALESWQKLGAEYPNAHLYRVESASALESLGALAERAGRDQDAEQASRRALELEIRILADDPMNSKCSEQLLANILRLASLLRRAGRLAEAENIYRTGLQTGKQLVLQVPWSRHQLGCVYNQFGLLLVSTGRWFEAEKAYQQALEIYEKMAQIKLASGPERWRRQELMWTHENLGHLFTKNGRPTEAEKAFRQSIAIGEKLQNDFPDQGYVGWLGKEYGILAALLSTNGRSKEADKEYRKLLELAPRTVMELNSISWLLATCADPKRRGGIRAVELAKKAVELGPKEGNNWNTLGVAQYRKGDWKAAIDALTKSMELLAGKNASFNMFFLAMAHRQLGEKPQARSWFDKAVLWMDKNQPKDEELLRFRAEAAAVLGVKEK